MRSKRTRQLRSARWHSTLFRRTVPLTALAMAVLVGTSGFRVLPDIDRANQKNTPTYNNAGLNSADVTPTDFTSVPRLASGLTDQVKGVHYAVVLKRRNTLFAGVDTGNATRAAAKSILDRASDWLSRQSPTGTHIYVSANPTLVNHFHRYAADRADHLEVSSDIILSDVQREFPGVK